MLCKKMPAASVVCLALIATGVSGCDDSEREWLFDAVRPEAQAPLSEHFVLKRRIILEEPDTAPIADLTDLGILPDGRLVVVDQVSSEVRLHDSSGDFLRFVARAGLGPGEVQGPGAVTVLEDGSFLVPEARGFRVSRFDRDLRYDTAFRPPETSVLDVGPLGADSLIPSPFGERNCIPAAGFTRWWL